MQIKLKNLPREPFTLLISGGVDSIAAAHWLKYSLKKDFNLLHFNHKCQPANEQMEESVRNFAKTFDFELKVITNTLCEDHSENGMRQWRTDNLNTLGGNYVTAHHLNDAVENYFQNMLRGNPEHKPIHEKVNFHGFVKWHPFISVTKADFENYSNFTGLNRYVLTDPSNRKNVFLRNWIRNEMLPRIEMRGLGLESVVRKKFYA